ncbi:type II toxin-antitoxin system death-on-curing family toxin [Rhodanobacter glycinis]|uniref:Type II toxin-antitoxin system death-on-curing family toxin n=1 Tax=Rhodanobacter glycinis TaxID=582702 RepID=A0A5B9E2J8_9GAMM|nr:type II toxin-antitoxin system death-on-curing family toxin [Rhodanobacter glycinis]QEE24750.1 type II toxin-antitoxin system death-on-curing family toxin [Rhodanobacter glycinis]
MHDIPFFDHEPVRREFVRWADEIGSDDPYVSNDLPGLQDVLRAHFLVVDYFYGKQSGLGGIGPKSMDLLHSALYRPYVSLGGVNKWRTSFERAATLIYGIVCDHPFHDANKRTGLLTLLLFFNKTSRIPIIGQRELEDFAVDIADHKLDKYPRYRSIKKSGRKDSEVLFIADHIERKSRKIDRTNYSITYRELDRILHKFGYKLDNPSGNYIDLIRAEQRRKIFSWGKKEQVDVKLAQIGFPGWKSQVNAGAVKTIRKAARLSAEDGFDSKTFYQGADPTQSIIAEYAAPLERLAFR